MIDISSDDSESSKTTDKEQSDTGENYLTEEQLYLIDKYKKLEAI